MSADKDDSQKLLHDEIIADAKRQSGRIIRRAEREAEALAAAEAEAAADYRAERLAQAEKSAAQRSQLVLAKVPVEIRRMRASHIERTLEGIRHKISDRLQAEEMELTRTQLLRLIAEPIGAMRGNSFILRLSDAERARVGEDFMDEVQRESGKGALSITWGDALPPGSGGPVITAADGLQSWDNRLSARLERMWPALRRALARQTGLATRIAAGEGGA